MATGGGTCEAIGPRIAQGWTDGGRARAVEPRGTSPARSGCVLIGVFAGGTGGLVGGACEGEVALVRTHLGVMWGWG